MAKLTCSLILSGPSGFQVQGGKFSATQMDTFADWGLVRRCWDSTGRKWVYESGTEERLELIRQSWRDGIGSLPRRVLWLRALPRFADVPGEKLRAAMVAVAEGKVVAPKTKLTELRAAIKRCGIRRFEFQGPPGWRAPTKDSWPNLLRDERVPAGGQDFGAFSKQLYGLHAYLRQVTPPCWPVESWEPKQTKFAASPDDAVDVNAEADKGKPEALARIERFSRIYGSHECAYCGSTAAFRTSGNPQQGVPTHSICQRCRVRIDRRQLDPVVFWGPPRISLPEGITMLAALRLSIERQRGLDGVVETLKGWNPEVKDAMWLSPKEGGTLRVRLHSGADLSADQLRADIARRVAPGWAPGKIEVGEVTSVGST